VNYGMLGRDMPGDVFWRFLEGLGFAKRVAEISPLKKQIGGVHIQGFQKAFGWKMKMPWVVRA